MSETVTPMMQRYQRLHPLLVAVTFALSWLNFIAPPRVLLAPELDLSWAGALTYFAERGVQHGRDIVCTWGPLGHLTSFVYDGVESRVE